MRLAEGNNRGRAWRGSGESASNALCWMPNGAAGCGIAGFPAGSQLHGAAGSGQFKHQTLHLRDENLKLAFQALPLPLHLPGASTADSALERLRGERKLTGTEDEEAVAQLLQGPQGEQGITTLNGRVQGLQAHGEVIEEDATELN